MKKVLFGYNIKDVNVTLDALREENESLNSTITTLKTELKNSLSDNGVKATLLEASIKEQEENFNKINEEKIFLSRQTEDLKQQNASLSEQLRRLQERSEELNRQFDEAAAAEVSVDNSALEELQSQLETERELRVSLEENLKNRMEELAAVTASAQEEDGPESGIPLDSNSTNHTSEITLQAYQNMTEMKNEVMAYIQGQMIEYYRLLNENNAKMRSALEQRQTEYNNVIRNFITQSSDFRTSLTSMNDEYGNMVDFGFSMDEISTRMNHIMEDFINKTGSSSQSEFGQEAAVNKEDLQRENEVINIPNKFRVLN